MGKMKELFIQQQEEEAMQMLACQADDAERSNLVDSFGSFIDDLMFNN